MTEKDVTNREANLFFEAELAKLHDGAFTAIRASSSIKDARLQVLVESLQEMVRIEDMKELQTRILVALNTDRILEGTLRLRSDGDVKRLNSALGKVEPKPSVPSEPPATSPPSPEGEHGALPEATRDDPHGLNVQLLPVGSQQPKEDTLGTVRPDPADLIENHIRRKRR